LLVYDYVVGATSIQFVADWRNNAATLSL